MSTRIDLHDCYASLGLAAAACIDTGWSKDSLALLERRHAELCQARERIAAVPATEVAYD